MKSERALLSESAPLDMHRRRLARGRLVGLVSAGALRAGTPQLEDTRWALAAELMQGPVSVEPEDDLRTAAERMLSRGLRALPVLGDDGRLLCLLGESELTGLYLRRAIAAERDAASLHNPEGETFCFSRSRVDFSRVSETEAKHKRRGRCLDHLPPVWDYQITQQALTES